ncbi:unnamed protein product [Dibothriocephalus latus]|uniref:Uncharacterized protein n=1 Tax=Dibothriocephalus latus TaxID=60516 RepID=A0A3P7P724_DIBLA|nr:unnamed protein product [Dibothriocephalus latus]
MHPEFFHLFIFSLKRVCATFFLYVLVLLALYVTIWSKEGISGTEGNDERMVIVREQWLANFLVNMAGYASILFPFMLLINLSEPLLNSWKSDKIHFEPDIFFVGPEYAKYIGLRERFSARERLQSFRKLQRQLRKFEVDLCYRLPHYPPPAATRYTS